MLRQIMLVLAFLLTGGGIVSMLYHEIMLFVLQKRNAECRTKVMCTVYAGVGLVVTLVGIVLLVTVAN